MKNWYDIYPKGTMEGDIEEKIFKSLTRSKKYKFRSVNGLSKELKIKEEIIEKVILKYSKKGIIIQNPQNDMQWGYWETCGTSKKKNYSVQEFDYKKRLEKIIDNDELEEEEDIEDDSDWEQGYI
jgi:hypothetical protein